MAARRPAKTARATTATKRRPQRRGPLLDPAIVRSLVGVVLLVVGAVTLIALLLPGEGILNTYVSGVLRPAFGQGAWLLPVLLLIAGLFVERAPSVGNGWGVTAVGGLVIFLGALGIIHLVSGNGTTPAALRNGGGWLGQMEAGVLTRLISAPGAFVVLLGLVVAGLLLLFNITIRSLFRPVGAGGRALAGAISALPAPRAIVDRVAEPAIDRKERGRAAAGGDDEQEKPARGRRNGRAAEATAAGDTTEPSEPDIRDLPAPISSPAPISQTVWAADPDKKAPAAGAVPTVPEAAAAEPAAAVLLEAEDALPVHAQEWVLPALEVLDVPRATAPGAAKLDHDRNIRIIEEKLRSFQIPATVTATNTGPVVTQYEVRPDARIKISRIEGLADDLAMALAARSIRIEAPIPGKDVVGIEIPNHSSEVVGFRQLIDDANMLDATGKLTFALGRDVSGKAYAVDLAKMPHLLIAGATGSGKSVCVNALITSLLMRAKPDEVRLVLVDLKRVELAPYDALPHLLTNVIVEAGDAKAALNWAVNQMEERYKALASRGERNIAAYNASPRIEPHERLPFIVVVIDELADLIMREGRKVEDPIVKIAQKARAVGIHLVLATQRPSVNVVTGLIKANVPSRIAFAMASNVDSRTVLDAPGAEDLIGRGDMLYQPADLPRPVRLQGVFVSDAEVRAVTSHWRDQAPEPEYDPAVLADSGGDDETSTGRFGWLAQMAEDDMTPRAAELIVTAGKASTSMLQTKLKLGFNRASRVIDELERYGIVGPQDPRNPAVPRQIYGPENWVRSKEQDDL